MSIPVVQATKYLWTWVLPGFPWTHEGCCENVMAMLLRRVDRSRQLEKKISMRLLFKSGKALACVSVLLMSGLPATAFPVVWHLSDEDSDIYILGTVHVLPPELDWQSEEIVAAFESADTIWFEAPVADPGAGMRTVQLMNQYGLNAPGNPLSGQISEEGRELLVEILSRFGIGASDLDAMRPWMAAMTLSMAFVQSQGYEPESGVDFVLWREANISGKEIFYFETLEQQVRFMADLPPEIEAAFLEQTLMEFNSTGSQLDELVTAWHAGDIATIDAVMNGETRDAAPEVHEVLLVERNRTWVQTIKETLAGSGTDFMAVGAGHVAGPEGLIELLRGEGFDVAGP